MKLSGALSSRKPEKQKMIILFLYPEKISDNFPKKVFSFTSGMELSSTKPKKALHYFQIYLSYI